MRARKHIAMIGTTAPSHIYPSLAVIRELVERGHRVSYSVGSVQAHLVQPTGAELITYESTLPQSDSGWSEDIGTSMRIFLDEGIAVLPQLVDYFDNDRPDVVLYDIGGHPGPILGARYGVPAVQVSPAFVAWDTFEQDNAEFYEALRDSASGKAYFSTFTSWLRANRIEKDAEQHTPDHILALIPRAMQPNADRVPESVQFVGPCLDPLRLAERWAPPSGASKVLLVSFGTSYNEQLPVYQACIEAFGGTEWHVVMAIGKRVDPQDLGELPDNVEVHDSVPQLAVLDHASAFVTHAGMGGCTESLWFGVPTVAIPQAVDQFANAAMLESIGVGRHLPADQVTAESLRETVLQVSGSQDVRSALDRIRAEVRANGGVRKAADAVEAFL